MKRPETFADRVNRIQHDHNISPGEAMRVANAERKIEALMTERGEEDAS